MPSGVIGFLEQGYLPQNISSTPSPLCAPSSGYQEPQIGMQLPIQILLRHVSPQFGKLSYRRTHIPWLSTLPANLRERTISLGQNTVPRHVPHKRTRLL
ncbi:protein of unknown function [Sterolibacterium denitrificans]|uniref:Uncharacterized protein n=1 Tax=Sterolibacterium denitrificans TaxID=157592 RepID=A0A7Z7MVL6_9PROT|nr:protein of unknown function [Sterolibacterium denitrificans]